MSLLRTKKIAHRHRRAGIALNDLLLLDTQRYILLHKHPEIVRARLEDLMRFSATALNSRGVHYWIQGGTLLGYFRDHGVIARDDDIDIWVLREHMRPAMIALRDAAVRNHMLSGQSVSQ